jgi:putative ABC transport system substrate-binding protein
MLTRWKAIFVVIVSASQLGLSPVAEQPHQIVLLIDGITDRIPPQEQGLRDGLEELGYVRGKNVIFTQLKGIGYDHLRSMMISHMQREKIDLIVALGTVETAVATNVTRAIPIVFLPVADPVASGFVKSLTKPQTNVTGLTFFTGPENTGKQLEVFKRVAPFLRQVTVLIDKGKESRSNGRLPQGFSTVASRLGIELKKEPVSSPIDVRQGVAALRNPLLDHGIFVLCSGLFKDLRDVAAAAVKQRLPLFGCNAFQVAEQNVLLSYAADLYSLGYRGARLVDRIFHGIKPQQLPVEVPRKFELVINGKAAEDIGLNIAPEILLLADRVYR